MHLEFSQDAVMQTCVKSSQKSPVSPIGQAHMKLLMVVFKVTQVPLNKHGAKEKHNCIVKLMKQIYLYLKVIHYFMIQVCKSF